MDTAPTGHTLRLLGMPASLRRIADILEQMQAKHRYLSESLAGRYRSDGSDLAIGEIDGPRPGPGVPPSRSPPVRVSLDHAARGGRDRGSAGRYRRARRLGHRGEGARRQPCDAASPRRVPGVRGAGRVRGTDHRAGAHAVPGDPRPAAADAVGRAARAGPPPAGRSRSPAYVARCRRSRRPPRGGADHRALPPVTRGPRR